MNYVSYLWLMRHLVVCWFMTRLSYWQISFPLHFSYKFVDAKWLKMTKKSHISNKTEMTIQSCYKGKFWLKSAVKWGEFWQIKTKKKRRQIRIFVAKMRNELKVVLTNFLYKLWKRNLENCFHFWKWVASRR